MCVRKSDYCVCLIALVSDRNNKYESFNYGTVVLPLSIQNTSSKPNTKSKEGKERHQRTKQDVHCTLYIIIHQSNTQLLGSPLIHSRRLIVMADEAWPFTGFVANIRL